MNRPLLLRAAPRAADRDARRDAALEALAERAGARGFRIAADLLGSAADAEDAVQEALVVAHQRYHSLRTADALDAWFVRILTNHCLKVLRRRRVVALFARRECFDRDGEAAAMAPSADVAFDRARQRVATAAALARVPGKQRAALVLRYGHGLSVAEVAGALGVGIGSARTHLHRGLARLRRELEEAS